MTPTFDDAFQRTIGSEGGYVNDPLDPGGETKYGISKNEYPDEDIANLTPDRAKFLYNRDFWQPVVAATGCSGEVADEMFDAAVEHGMGNAIRMLQEAINVAPDGHFGPASRAAFAAMPEVKVLILFLAKRIRFITRLNQFVHDGAGWTNRIAARLEYVAADEFASTQGV